ncbi:MAG TPA: ATP-binding protein [Candidatus Sulfotelmatobacter sp.]|nr:ATP-binding protein [Candidatus Sulfotelmatobacter sp.]
MVVSRTWFSPPSGSIGRYSIAVAATVVALYIRVLIAPFFGSYVPYPPVWVAVAFSTWCCGLGPSLVTIAISVVGIWFWFPHMPRTFAQENGLAGLVGFVVFAGLIVAIGEVTRRSTARGHAAEREALRSRLLFDAFMDNSPAIAYMKDRDGRLMYLNRTARKRFGVAAKEGRTDEGLIPWEDPAANRDTDLQIIRNGKPHESIDYTEEADGRHAWLSVRFVVSDPESGSVFLCGKSFEVTDRVNAEQALIEAHRQLENRVEERTAQLRVANQNLRDLSARLLQIRDEEHRRIARELHDSVGQLLAALSMNISLLHRESADLPVQVQKAMAESVELVDQASREIRTISHLLHPPLLDEVGLASALRWFVDGFSQRSGIRVDLEIAAKFERLQADYELALFRLVQECLTNIHRHSGSDRAEIQVRRKDDWFCLEVKDWGAGIPHEKLTDLESDGKAGMSGVGIRGMRERIRLLGGTLEIDSNGEGTTIRASLPANRAARLEGLKNDGPKDEARKSVDEQSPCEAA